MYNDNMTFFSPCFIDSIWKVFLEHGAIARQEPRPTRPQEPGLVSWLGPGLSVQPASIGQNLVSLCQRQPWNRSSCPTAHDNVRMLQSEDTVFI